jgi:tRNA (adenine22-N1)-methyltransferase
MQQRMLDPRLSLAFDLYDPCELAADIGTDHAHLPAALLQRGRCRHMILTDISESALENARMEMIRLRLTDRVSLRLGDGLSPVSEECGMISIMGMGGRTIRDILLSGKARLRNASLILSAHTDWHLIRSAVCEIGYHLDREEPCLAAGRFYLVLRARPGKKAMTDREIRLGGPLFSSESEMLVPFLRRRKEVLKERLKGVSSATAPNESELLLLKSDLDFYERFLLNRDS